MICYKDMTFCTYWKSCKDGKDCHRKLTDDIRKESDKYGMHICQFAEKPNCYKEKECK